ncbi:MAG: hypothetical protein LBD27_01180 [Tannerella sp.]|jgi:hypothetical protein|nr:hypothetical protein [Tannerella sp.]
MAKNKKRKKTVTHRPKTQISLKQSKTHLEECYVTARRIIRALNEDPVLLDEFSKRQKQELFRVNILPPRIVAMPGYSVPRQYIRYVQEELIFYLRKAYYDEPNNVTWMDMLTCGQTMLMMFKSENFLHRLPEKQKERVTKLNEQFEIKDIFFAVHKTVAIQVKTTLMMLSQPNFRIYGQGAEMKLAPDKSGIVQTIQITTHESQSLHFKYRNRERLAFRVAVGRFLDTEYTGATIALSKIYPGVEQDRMLNIYIQSHAIHRFKERINTFYPIMRNEFFVLSLMMAQQVVRGYNGMQLIACIAPTPAVNDVRPIGYFVFTIDGDNLFVLTLLPLLSKDAPEGHLLCKRLHLSTEDLIYLGMDKLSFFYEVDIEQIPQLKEILFDELHLDYIRSIYNSFRSKEEPFDEKKTLFVKEYFRKMEEEQPVDRAKVLSELADAENLSDEL